jgi:hypothetical protein
VIIHGNSFNNYHSEISRDKWDMKDARDNFFVTKNYFSKFIIHYPLIPHSELKNRGGFYFSFFDVSFCGCLRGFCNFRLSLVSPLTLQSKLALR